MPEWRTGRGPQLAAWAAGVALAAAAGLGGAVAAVAGWLAQAAFARALRPHAGARLRDLGGLLLVWGGALVAVAALVAWPLAALRAGGGLGSALALSLACGLALVGLWRLWPLWRAQEREGG
ncbi:MAG TPA: hypothetical protein VFG18_05435, partial [Xanthomonadaceae bacterium]|nr:hypothetical protein [Xanthomonadaceae bacterium]